MTAGKWIAGALEALALAVLMFAASAVFAQEPSPAAVERGRKLASQACALCHAISGPGPSPLKDAPPFATLLQAFPGRNLEEIVADGLMTPHQPMPMFLAGEMERADLLAYLKTIQRRRTVQLDQPWT